MRATALLYGALGAAALIVGIAVPYAVHEAGGAAVPGWQGLVSPGPLSQAHRFIAAECETCHTPHKGVAANNCITCHAATSFGDKQSTRFHAQAKRCTTCHIEHQGDDALVAMNHEALLSTPSWQLGPPGHRELKSPTYTTRRGIDVAALDCATCHSNRDPHRSYFGSECSDCHSVTAWAIGAYRHPSVNSKECAQCHKAPPSHRMMHFEMVSQAYASKRAPVEQCFACHTTDDWNNIRGRGWYDHH